MPKVIVPPSYQGPTRGVGQLQVEGATIRACLEAIEREHAGFLAQVVGPGGNVHRFVKLFVNGDHVTGDPGAHRVESGDEIEIVAAIAGG